MNGKFLNKHHCSLALKATHPSAFTTLCVKHLGLFLISLSPNQNSLISALIKLIETLFAKETNTIFKTIGTIPSRQSCIMSGGIEITGLKPFNALNGQDSLTPYRLINDESLGQPQHVHCEVMLFE